MFFSKEFLDVFITVKYRSCPWPAIVVPESPPEAFLISELGKSGTPEWLV